MSFSLCKAGKPEDVSQQVSDADVYGDLAGEAAKKFIIEMVNLSGSDGVIVEANGHSGTERGGRVTINIVIKATY